MKSTLMRLLRILVAQSISWSLLEWGGVNIPQVNITIGAAVNAIFKFIRDKFPKSVILEWLPL
jgi:hypothetical protein